ncbi:MAG: hypothetical protein HQM14_02460 [SAR324 cluster bacterium]|nr:hypothetical protein [SAR324 cluster bacterium]
MHWKYKQIIFLVCVFIGIVEIPGLLAQTTFEVTGRLIHSGGKIIEDDDIAVVLLKFTLDKQGQLRTDGPLARTKTVAGRFKFEGLLSETEAAYQIGSRYQGELISSKFFFLQPDQKTIDINVIVPGVSEKTKDLQLQSVAVFIEPGMEMLQITEVLRIVNPGPDVIDTQNNPMVFELPDAYQAFSQIHESSSSKDVYQLAGQQLQIIRQFAPGPVTLIFKYNIAVPFGSHQLEKQYRYSLQKGQILIPAGQIKIESPHLKKAGLESFGSAQFEVWKMKALDNPQLKIHLSAIPMGQTIYIYLGVGLFVVLIFLAFGFVRMRLSVVNNTKNYAK